ncbi:hypothetical protein ABWK22_21635, partial [Gottfriedia acidiceleris]|uniref:Ger(x)C family spore germination protein n=1 Tax=Gottfriedia acidiceleris TaxID=371036 RepID=UPI003392CAF4
MNRLKNSKRKVKFIIQIVLSIILCFLLNGCIPKNIIDEIGIVHIAGVDVENGMLKSSVIFPNYTEDKKATMVSVLAKDPAELKANIGYKSQYHNVMGQIQTFILGDTYSKLGISKVIESVCKDPVILNVSFAVSEIPIDEVMKPLLKKTPLYLTNVIEQGYKYDGLPETNLHSLESQYYDKGTDIYLPTINLDNEGEIQLNGLAIFKGDKV